MEIKKIWGIIFIVVGVIAFILGGLNAYNVSQANGQVEALGGLFGDSNAFGAAKVSMAGPIVLMLFGFISSITGTMMLKNDKNK